MEKIFVFATCLFLAIPANAQTVEQDGANDSYGLKTDLAERVFLKYHRSIRAEEKCNNRNFSDQDKAAMDQVAVERMQANSPEVAVGAARLLTLSRVADDQADDMISDQGCDGADTKKSLQFFDQRLANIAPAPAPEKSPEESADAPAGQ